MASILLTGELLDPSSEYAVGDKIRFTHKTTTGDTIENAISIVTIDPSGQYSIELQYGLILVEYKDIRNPHFKYIGVVTVNGDSTATTLPELLVSIIPPTDEQLLEFQAILANCITAQNAAEQAAIEAVAAADQTIYTFPTVAAYKASTITFPVGKCIFLKDRNAYFDVINGTGTADNYGVIASNQVSQSAVVDTSGGFYGKAFGLTYNGSTDDTLAWRAVASAALPTKSVVHHSVGTALITDTISCPIGTKWKGETSTSYDGYGVDQLGFKIDFQPTTSKPLFDFDGTDHGGFRFHYHMSHANILGNANATAALNLDHVIYSDFENMAIVGFDEAIVTNGTINNNFFNILIDDSSIACISYEGNNETTDVWQKCTFFGSPIGINLKGSSISIRFDNCNYEQLNTGMRIAKECQTIMVTDGYGEDIAFDGASTGAMFEVGLVGTTAVTDANLIVSGGKYAGRNAGTVGAFVSIDDSYGVVVDSVSISRWTTGILTTSNTRDDSVLLGGIVPLSVGTQVSDLTKINGLYPHGNIVDSGAMTRMRTPVILTREIRQESTLGIQFAKIGEKLAFYGGTPIEQPSGTGETTGWSAGGGVAATSATTATGNLGSTAYRFSDIVKALKQVGLIAQ